MGCLHPVKRYSDHSFWGYSSIIFDFPWLCVDPCNMGLCVLKFSFFKILACLSESSQPHLMEAFYREQITYCNTL